MKTVSTRPQDVRRAWLLIDAEGQTLGRMASEIAAILRGKWKPSYTPHVDCGDHVVVVNAERVRLTGRKSEQKTYFRHSLYPGGEKIIPFQRMLERKPEEIIRLAVRGMLPKTKLGRQMITKLQVYKGPEHPHAAQKPVPHRIGTHGRELPGRNDD
jgi:large subunit ribosomal protein L13